MRLLNEKFWDGFAFTADTSYNSDALWLGHMGGCAIQLDFTADTTTVNGVFSLQASADGGGEQGSAAPTNWTTIDSSSFTISAEATGNYFWNVEASFFRWIRVVFTADGGGSDSAVVNATINAKGF